MKPLPNNITTRPGRHGKAVFWCLRSIIVRRIVPTIVVVLSSVLASPVVTSGVLAQNPLPEQFAQTPQTQSAVVGADVQGFYRGDGQCRAAESHSAEDTLFLGLVNEGSLPAEVVSSDVYFCLGVYQFSRGESDSAHISFVRALYAANAAIEASGNDALRDRATEIRTWAATNVGNALMSDGNYLQALGYLLFAASSGNPSAQNLLGILYREGDPPWLRSAQESGRWFFVAAQSGEIRAMHNMARILNRAGDFAEALRWARATKDARDLALSKSSVDAIRRNELIMNVEELISELEGKVGAVELDDNALHDSGRRRLASTGSGFYVNEQGHILTAAHVVSDCSYVSVMSPMDRFPRFVRMTDRVDNDMDLAILHDGSDRSGVLGGVAALRSRHAPIRAGEYVVATGYPLYNDMAFEMHTTTGVVVAQSRNRRNMVVSAPIQSGNSGGPVMDGNGGVIGVVVKKRDLRERPLGGRPEVVQNVNDAVAIELVRAFLEEHRVGYQENIPVVAPSGPSATPDVSATARRHTVWIGCWESIPD